jgi:hypothetical protein
MPDRGTGLDPVDIEAVVRVYVARVARRYTPLFGALVVLLLLATLIPSRSPSTTASNVSGEASGVAGDGGGSLGTDGGGTAASGGGAGGARSNGSGGGTIVGGRSFTPPAAAGTRGVTRGGIACGPGVRQVSFTVYAPPCIPKYTGNNGGTRFRGVTKDKIVAFYRHARSAQDTAINAALGDANLDDDKYIADLKTYMGYFNKQFELYGRHVELAVYDGQGDYLNEDQGLDQGQAQADAQRAVDLNGFVDATFPLKGSYPYWQALAERKALTLGPTGFPQGWYEERAPYWYSVLPTGTGVANWLSMLVCRRMVNMNAVWTDDTLYRARKRVFGLVHPDNPEYRAIGDLIDRNTAKCGAKPVRRIRYTFNVADMGRQATSVVAQLKAANVSTALCFCDPVFPIFVTNAANSQDYHPEWWSPGWGDSQAQQLPQDQWSHAFVIGGRYPDRKSDEAYRVYKLANPKGEPVGPYYAVAYAVVLMLYDALQQAGPDLNPANFQKGWFSMGSIKGPAGTLEWKPGHFSPVVSAPVAWYNPNKQSNFNGNQGSYETCQGGKFFPFDPAKSNEWGSGQLNCFGK